MHEMGLAQNILDVVLRSAQENQVKKVLRITMRAGQLRAIVPEQLKFCFGFVAKDSLADGAELVIHVVPIQARCKGCQLCATVCPKKLVGVADYFNSLGYRPSLFIDPQRTCTGCMLCAVICPEAAITVLRDDARVRV